jgi:hypothetical protein
MYRYDIINKIIKENGFKSYLEIGVCNPADCFDKIECENKDSVDPGVEFTDNPVKYPVTSDYFFSLLNNNDLDLHPDYKWDVIFIDGLHISTQVMKDVLNSLQHLSWNGYILLHDCNPPTIDMAREDYKINGVYKPWNGTTWKVMYWVRTHRGDLQSCVVDTDWGIGIIRKGMSLPISFDNPFYEYNQMSSNRVNDLGLISINELDSWLNGK